jgi:hypothetical protein
MSTNGIESWAVDLKDVGAIYPFQGWEMPMVIAGIAFWVLWHIWQISAEDAELRRKSSNQDPAKSRSAIDRY